MRRPGTHRRGLAIPIVLGLLLLVLPIVFILSFRSHSTLRVHVRQEHQREAIELAQEAELAAREALRTDAPALTGSHRIQSGGMEYQVLNSAANRIGQAVYLIAGEGVFQGEQRMMLGLVEVVPGPPGGPPILIEHDRAWLYSERGGALVRLASLQADFQTRIQGFLARLVAESAIPEDQFVNRLMTQSDMLDCPDVHTDRAGIEARLRLAHGR